MSDNRLSHLLGKLSFGKRKSNSNGDAGGTNSSVECPRWEKRLQKEMMTMVTNPPEGITVDKEAIVDMSQWTVEMRGPASTLYDGETFILSFKFGPKYPFDSPEVVFKGDNIPVHPHIYSNGHICLSILTEDWSPALSVETVCLSIISMLASAKEKKRPPDNNLYVRTCNKNPKKTRWWYHDNDV